LRVLVVDDHSAFRRALTSALRMVKSIEVAGEAGGGVAAAQQAQALAPDLVIMDLSMPDLDGIAAMLLQGVLTTAVTRFDAARLRAALRPGALIGLGSLAAYLLVLFAFRLAPVGRVATLRETSVLLAILLSREQPRAATWAGAALCVVGALLAAA